MSSFQAGIQTIPERTEHIERTKHIGGAERSKRAECTEHGGSVRNEQTQPKRSQQRKQIKQKQIKRPGKGRARTPIVALLVLVGPFVVLFAAVYLVPLVYSIYQSLFKLQASGLGFGPTKEVFVGLGNYLQVVTDSTFWLGIGRVFAYGIIQIPIMLILAMIIALLLDSRAARATKFFRLMTFLPYAVPGIVAALIWVYLYVPQLSPLIKSLDSIGWHINLLGQNVILFSIANIIIWSCTGYNMIIYMSALNAIPPEIIEAARVDGASEWKIAIRIKVPMIGSSIGLTALLSFIGTIQLFNEPTLLRTVTTSVSADWTPMMMAYNALGSNNVELSSAISVVAAIIAGILAVIYQLLSTRNTRRLKRLRKLQKLQRKQQEQGKRQQQNQQKQQMSLGSAAKAQGGRF